MFATKWWINCVLKVTQCSILHKVQLCLMQRIAVKVTT